MDGFKCEKQNLKINALADQVPEELAPDWHERANSEFRSS